MIGIKIIIQKWLIHKSERGFHIVGGILQACTWWIFCIGFIYTLIRKKVPYLPTPKEDKINTHFAILLPNFIVILISVSAIVYGLSIDFTPFTIFMSGFAALNIFYLLFSFVFAYEKPKSVVFSFGNENQVESRLDKFKNFNTQVFRKVVLPIAIIGLFTSVSIQYYNRHLRWESVPSVEKIMNSVNYFGIFSPNSDNGITSLRNVQQISEQTDIKFSIVSLYLAWDQNIQSSFPENLLDSIYLQKSLPLITWEPWINSFEIDQKVANKQTHL